MIAIQIKKRKTLAKYKKMRYNPFLSGKSGGVPNEDFLQIIRAVSRVAKGGRL